MLLAVVGALTVIGLVMVMSASAVVALEQHGSSWVFVQRQALWAGLGIVALVLMSRVDYRVLRRAAGPLLLVAVVLLVLVFVPGLGIRASGSTRWIGVGPLTVQPAELAKLALLVYAADVFARRAASVEDWRRALRPVLLVFVVLAALVLRQPDMGTAMVLALVVGTVVFAGGARLRHLLPLASVGLAAAVFLAFAAPYRRARVLSFLDPFSDPANTGYQAVQSLIALGGGGLFGVGLGAGRQKWLFLPNAHTDFIFAVIGEELGLVGAMLVVVLFVGFAVLGYRAAVQAPDRFGELLAAGVTTWIVGQAVINIGAAIGLLPITGVPLPFVSFGGSALLVTMAAVGVLLNVARQGAASTAPARARARR